MALNPLNSSHLEQLALKGLRKQCGTTYNGLPAKDVGIETNEFSTDVQSTLNENVFLQCTRIIYNRRRRNMDSEIK